MGQNLVCREIFPSAQLTCAMVCCFMKAWAYCSISSPTLLSDRADARARIFISLATSVATAIGHTTAGGFSYYEGSKPGHNLKLSELQAISTSLGIREDNVTCRALFTACNNVWPASYCTFCVSLFSMHSF
jgi:hypothetical protein